MMYGMEAWVAPSKVMERLDCTERELLRLLLGYFWPMVCHNEGLYGEIDGVIRRMRRGRYQHLAHQSWLQKNCLLWSHIKETSRSPCSTGSEEFVGFELEEATWPKTKVLDEVEEEDPQRGQAIQARRKISQNME